MSERNARPATADNVGWNTTPTNQSTDPGGALRAAGWAVNAIPGSEELNYLQTMWGDFLQWLEGYLCREWADIAEASPTAMAVGERLAVVPPAAGAAARGSAVFSGVASGATGGGNIYHLCTDGEYGYYVSGGGGAAQTRVVKFNMATGAVLEQDEFYSGNAISALAVDGSAVFTTGANVANPGLSRWTRADLAIEKTVGAEYGHVRLVCNGYHAAGIAPTGGLGKVTIYSDINGAIVEDGSYDTGSSITNVAIDAERAYIGGTRSTYDVWAVDLVARTLTWSTTFPTSSAPTVSGIAADGDHVYVGTDRIALTAGGFATLYCLSRTTGAVLWTADLGADSYGVTVDDRYLYTGDAAGLYQVSKQSPAAIVATMAAVGALYECVTDGVSLLAVDTPVTTFSRYWTQAQKRKEFVRANPEDPWRMPFHRLVIPV